MDNIFYVYVYLDPNKPGKYEYNSMCFLYEPFYVGKGKNDRKDRHLYCYTNFANKHKNNKIKKIKKSGKKPIIVLLYEKILNEEAKQIEIDLIAEIGRFKYDKNNIHKEGPLVNMTDGGEGATGYKHTEATRLKISVIKKKFFKEHPEAIIKGAAHYSYGKPGFNKGVSPSKETREKISHARLGKSFIDLYGEEKAKELKEKIRQHHLGTKHPHSEETKKKLSELQQGKSYVDKLGSEERAREVIEKIRAKNTGKKRTQKFKDSLSGCNNPFYGKTHSDESRKKISEAGKGRIPPNKDARTFIKLDLNGNLIEALPSSKIPLKWKCNVSACANGRKKSAYGFIWKYKK